MICGDDVIVSPTAMMAVMSMDVHAEIMNSGALMVSASLVMLAVTVV